MPLIYTSLMRGEEVCAFSPSAFRMKTFLLLVVLMTSGLSQVQGSLKQLQDIIQKLTGKNALVNYGFYGCHCGLGGRGIPKDATDRCCADHDCCYSRLVKKGCHPKTVKYNYSYHNDVITCGTGSNCQHQICFCDRTVGHCMLRNLRTYHPKYQSFPNILCWGSKPLC